MQNGRVKKLKNTCNLLFCKRNITIQNSNCWEFQNLHLSIYGTVYDKSDKQVKPRYIDLAI